jgi:hypothetical protein
VPTASCAASPRATRARTHNSPVVTTGLLDLRACRDSNPKPSDLWRAVRRLVAKLGHLIAGGDRTPVQTASEQGGAGAGAVIIELPVSRIQAGEPAPVPATERASRAHLTVVS